MIEVRRTAEFIQWLAKLPDKQAKAKIDVRVQRVRHGNFGDVKPVGEGVSELRIHHGPGYRVYFVQRGAVVVVLLCGGDKSTQDKDIKAAIAMAKEV